MRERNIRKCHDLRPSNNSSPYPTQYHIRLSSIPQIHNFISAIYLLLGYILSGILSLLLGLSLCFFGVNSFSVTLLLVLFVTVVRLGGGAVLGGWVGSSACSTASTGASDSYESNKNGNQGKVLHLVKGNSGLGGAKSTGIYREGICLFG